MKNLTVKFAFKAETAGAVRYEEVNEKGKVLTTRDDECVIGALYLRKSQVGTKAPKTLILTIEGSGAVTTEPAKEKKAAPATENVRPTRRRGLRKTTEKTTAKKKNDDSYQKLAEHIITGGKKVPAKKKKVKK